MSNPMTEEEFKRWVELKRIELQALTDDELFNQWDGSQGEEGGLESEELWRRYKNKKKECEELEKARDNNWRLYTSLRLSSD